MAPLHEYSRSLPPRDQPLVLDHNQIKALARISFPCLESPNLPDAVSEHQVRGRRTHLTCLPITDALNIVNNATSELSDLINRLDLIATPSASPARNWLATPSRSPDGVPDFALATVERALRQRYPDVPTSVQSGGNTTFTGDSSLSSEATPQNAGTMRGISSMQLSGSVADLRRGVGPGPFVSGSLRAESSITSLRPYRAANKSRTALPAIHFSPSSDFESRRAGAAPYTPAQRRAARRPRASVSPREQSSDESLRSKLESLGSEPRPRRDMSFISSGDFSESDYSSGRDDPTSESADDEQSDIPDELRNIIDHFSDDSRSFRDSLSPPPSRPLSEMSDQFSSDIPSPSRAHPFSMTVTAPSIGSHHDSDPEFAVNSEDDTGKKSFDFTGEINRLNRAGGARISFMEQMEAAFKPSEDVINSPSLGDFGSEQAASPTALEWGLSNAGSNVSVSTSSTEEIVFY